MSSLIAPLFWSDVLNFSRWKTFGLPSIRISVIGCRSVAAVVIKDSTASGNWTLGTLDRSPTTIVSGAAAPDRQVPASGFAEVADEEEQLATATVIRPMAASV